MMGDYHVRCCERLGVKFPLSTRRRDRCTQAKKKPTARSSTFHFARTSQNKKSFHFPTATRKILLYLSVIDKFKFTSQMNKRFGEYIRELRTKQGLTLTQLGAKLDLDSANLSKIENGKREFDEKRLNLLAQVFQLNLDELKTEFFSDLFAKKLYESKCSTNALRVAEEKIKYLRQINVKQESLKL